ncbi:hypothetical protein MMC22_007022 [Lobaria immixta]|nr:hypothetical protein [Lobaria immixta]
MTICLLNNYFGYYLNGLNDLAVHKNGDIWFTDTKPDRDETTHGGPISLRLRRKRMLQELGSLIAAYNDTGHRMVYAYDVKDEVYLTNKRPVYQIQSLAAHGMKVAKNGYIVTTAGYGVDIFDHHGTVIAILHPTPKPGPGSPFQGKNPHASESEPARAVCARHERSATGQTPRRPGHGPVFPGHNRVPRQGQGQGQGSSGSEGKEEEEEVVVVVAVLDVDCAVENGFDEVDELWLGRLAALLAGCCDWDMVPIATGVES